MSMKIYQNIKCFILTHKMNRQLTKHYCNPYVCLGVFLNFIIISPISVLYRLCFFFYTKKNKFSFFTYLKKWAGDNSIFTNQKSVLKGIFKNRINEFEIKILLRNFHRDLFDIFCFVVTKISYIFHLKTDHKVHQCSEIK